MSQLTNYNVNTNHSEYLSRLELPQSRNLVWTKILQNFFTIVSSQEFWDSIFALINEI